MLLLKFYFYFIIGVNSFEIKVFQKVENCLAWEELCDSTSRALYTCISLKEITERGTDIKVNIGPR